MGDTGGARMSWVGSTVNAVGTYAGPDSIIANPNLLFDGDFLYPAQALGVTLGKADKPFTAINAYNGLMNTLVVDTINFGDSTTFIRTDSAGALIFEDVVGGPYELAELLVEASVNTLISYTTCADNTTTDIAIGDSDDRSFLIHYIAERNMGTVQQQSGEITVNYDSVSGDVDVSVNLMGLNWILILRVISLAPEFYN